MGQLLQTHTWRVATHISFNQQKYGYKAQVRKLNYHTYSYGTIHEPNPYNMYDDCSPLYTHNNVVYCGYIHVVPIDYSMYVFNYIEC